MIDTNSFFSLCNISCDGDALQKCGGENLLQIFGPPPSSPAVGHNVVPKCEPWCVTADSNTVKVCFLCFQIELRDVKSCTRVKILIFQFVLFCFANP